MSNRDRSFTRRPLAHVLARSAAAAIVAAGLAVVGGAIGGATASADEIRLKSGAVLQGKVVKRSERAVWLDVGPDVLEFAIEDVEDVVTDDASTGLLVQEPETLYFTARELSELSPKEQTARVGPTVVKVSTPGGLGSGVIINPGGYVVTNAHVIQGELALRCIVWLPQDDGTLARTTIEDVEIVAVNNHLDLALLRMEHPDGEPFDFAPIETEERIEVGQTVFAIGNPLGLEQTMSQGVVSTKQRSFDGVTYIQTDTAVNPGNSGGPLFNTRGEIVGITNMKIPAGESLNFAIPARYLKDFVRNREAFAFDEKNPNSGHNYHDPPARRRFGAPPMLDDGSGEGG